MKNKYFVLSILYVLLSKGQYVLAQDNGDELTDGPQTLEAPATTDATMIKANGPVVSEEELITPKPKKTESVKVTSDKVNEGDIYIQDSEKFKIVETFKNLQLNDVIEQGLRQNYDQGIRDHQANYNELEFSGVKRAFWIPELKLTLTSSEQHISTLYSGNSNSSAQHPNTPTGSLGLSLGNYTVFNWGKDYALYLNNKSTYERNQKILEESKREFRLDLIAQYFTLLTSKNIEKINQEQLRQASFVYRLNKEKVAVGKVSKQDYYLARSEYLRSQNEYRSAKSAADALDESMAFTLTDEVGTKYIMTEALAYQRLKVTLDTCLEFAAKTNPRILNSKIAIENANRTYDVALKENLPLPKFSVNLGAYAKQFGPTTNKTTYSNYSNSGDIELVASVNATWSLTGADGLFNSDKLAKSRMNKELLYKELDKNDHMAKSLLRQTFNNVLSAQNQLLILDARIPTLQKTFDTVLDNYLNNKIKFSDFHLILTEITQAKTLLEETKLQHLKEKLLLAKLSGIEDFPGENFDKAAVLKKEPK